MDKTGQFQLLFKMKVKGESMKDEKAEINSLLNKLLNINGSESATVLSQSGHLIGMKSKTRSTKTQAEEFLSNFINTCVRIVSKANFGNIDHILIQDTARKIIIHKIQKKDIFVTLSGNSKMISQSANSKVEKKPSFIEKT